jgi:hypothetical protein
MSWGYSQRAAFFGPEDCLRHNIRIFGVDLEAEHQGRIVVLTA